MLEGLMQHDHPLTLQHLLARMRTLYADSEVVSVRGDELSRTTFGEVAERVDRLAAALAELGVRQGDRVATFSWNNREHLEAYLAIPCMGAVLHTLNIRLFAEQLTYVVNHAEDAVIIVDGSLVPILEPLASTFETVRHIIVIGDEDAGTLPNVLRYEELLAAQEPGGAYPQIDDAQAAGLCYTSGTTGNPKGVLYSHRSSVLHSFVQGLADGPGLRDRDRVMPVVPMFHANAWGLPYAAALLGSDLVLPGGDLSGRALARLIDKERVTVAGGVPTIWMDMLRHVDEHETDLSSLRLLLCGGSAVPLSLMQAFAKRHGVEFLQAWGMTETSPVASAARPPARVDEQAAWGYRASAGRPLPLVEARLRREHGDTPSGGTGGDVPWDGESTGELQVRGPWVARAYYGDESSDEKFDQGWLRTGDIAAIDERGFVHITDRSKDVIKSGGEWISSVELENEIMAHPAVLEAAVIAAPDERWGERPLACIVPQDGAGLTLGQLRDHLGQRVAKWWLPDRLAILDEVPKTSVGKFDKKLLRARLEAGELEVDAVPG